MIKQIEILSEVIATTLHRVEITDGSIVDNGDNTWTFETCFTFYLNIGKFVVIDSVKYRIKNFVLNTSLTVEPISGTTPVTATGFDIDSPIFKNGSPQLVNKEFFDGDPYPYIWLVQINTIKNDGSFEALVTSVMDTRLMFMMDCLKDDWFIKDHYTNAIYPLQNEISFIMKIIQKRTDLFGEQIDWETTDHPNFGDYLIDQGNKTQIITDEVSGVLLQLDLPYVVDVCDDCDTPIVSKCFAATDVIKDSEGNLLYTNTIQSGALNNQTIQDATNTFNGNSINGGLAEGNKDIIVQDDSPIPVQLGTVITNDKDELIIEVSASSGPPLNTSNTYKSGATVSFQSQDDGDKEFGRGFDFFTLNFNNGFSNTNRFTDDLGTQIYLSGVIIDWATWNQVTETVTAYFKTPESSTTLTNHINNQPFTKNSLSNWWVCNPKQLINVFNYGIFRNYLNYAPFNHSMSLTPDRVWTSTRENVSNGIFVFTSGVSVSNQSSNYRAFVCRVYTLSELGL